MTATSTILTGAAGAAVGGAAAGCAPAGVAAAAGAAEIPPVAATVVLEWLNIFDIRLLSKPIIGPFYLLLV
jgi:hypothetical protein